MNADKVAKKEGAPALSEAERAWVCGFTYGYDLGYCDSNSVNYIPKRLRVYARDHSTEGCDAVGCDLFPKAKP